MLESTEYKDTERLDLPSASQMSIIVECPGQPNLKRRLPPETLAQTEDLEDKEWADRGTKIHRAFETNNTTELDPEEFRIYQDGLKHEQLLVQKWIHDKALDPAKVVEGPRELRIWIHNPFNYPELMGSAKLDRHYIYKDPERTCLLVLDLKSGWNPNLSPPTRSWQLKFQLTALWKEEYDNVTDGRVAFVKPKTELSQWDYCDYEMMDLKYSFDALAYHLWYSSQEDAPRHAGAHCRFCPARNGHCPEALAYALLPSVIVKNVFSKKAVPAAVNEVTPQDLYVVWRKGTIIRNILDGVTTRLKGMPEELLTELGLKLAPGRETSEIVRIKEAMEALQVSHGWTEESVYGSLKFVTGRMVEYLTLKGMDEKAAKAWIADTLAPFIELKVSEKILKEI